MKQRKSDVMRVFALATLLCGLAGCGASDTPAEKPEEHDPVEAAVAELGTTVTGCADTGYAATGNGTLTLALTAAQPVVLSAPGGKLNANGYTCTATIMSVNQALTTTNVSKIIFTGSSGADKVILDLLPGTFGTKILGSMGGITVDFSSGGADSFMIRGGTGNETYKFGKSSTTTDVYVEISGDKVADVWIKPGGSVSYAASMGGGADTLMANPTSAAMDITAFGTSAVVIAPMATAITAYGGAGDDRFTGGEGNDAFYGGEGNDTFNMGALTDGADTYIGEGGTGDTVNYGNRTATVTVDIGPATVSRSGSAVLSTLTLPTDVQTLAFAIRLDGETTDRTVTFTTGATTPALVVSQINTQVGATVAAIGTGGVLTLSTVTNKIGTAIQVVAGGAALTPLGLTAGTTGLAQANDGLGSETDDVRYTTENITGGTGDDTLTGDVSKNTIKGGAGNDTITGGLNTAVCSSGTSADGDTLQGEAGNDTFLMPVINCWASLQGGAGDNVADFSSRTLAISISNNGQANDGDTATDEKANIATDILKLIGGAGADTLTGGAGNDILVGGAGGDKLIGGAGTDDIADYSAKTANTNVTPCFAATVDDCTADDGVGGATEGDTVYQIEHLIGGTMSDTFDCTGVTVDMTLEGKAGTDTLTGGDGNDTIWGDDGNDTLAGGAGDDNLNGGLNTDSFAAGAGDGDICVIETGEVNSGCEL